MGKYVKQASFAALSWLIVLLVAMSSLEVFLRLTTEPSITPGYRTTHPNRRHMLRPNFKGWTYDRRVEFNSMAIREPEGTLNIGPETKRILVMGDSVTFGIGVDLEETFPKLLEKKLKAQGQDVQVLNMGVPSYSTVTELHYLKEVYDKLKPDLVIFEFTAGNDTLLTELPVGIRVNEFAVARWAKDILRHLYSYDWLAQKFYAVSYKFFAPSHSVVQGKNGEVAKRLSWDEALFDEAFKGWQDCKAAFRETAEFGRQKNVPIIFALYINNVEIAPREQDDLWYPVLKKVREALANAGIRNIVTLDDAFRAYSGKEKELWVRPDDSHFSVLGHELMAEHLFQAILENAWWPPRP